MKKLIFILMTIFFVFAITGCTSGDEEEVKKDTRKFWAQNFKTNTFYQVEAEKLAENARCIVWAEKGSGVDEATANSMASAYNTIYTKMMNTFGWQIDDEDDLNRFGSPGLYEINTMEFAHYLATSETSNAKLTILLLDIKDGYTTPGNPYTAGYFHSLNLMPNEPNNPKYPQLKYSNELDMIYVDTYPGVPGSPDSNKTLAHEMQHLMNFVTSYVCRGVYDEDDELIDVDFMDTWIDEGLSTAAEWVYPNEQNMNRVDWFNNNTNRGGEINKGNNFFVWDNHDNNTSAILDDYATVYLFFQYLRLQSGKPNDIYYDIHTSEYNNYEAVTNANSINSTHKNKWDLLLRDWFAANYTNSSTGLYGYKNDDKLKSIKAPMLPGGTTSVNLYPGEGVCSQIGGTGGTLPTTTLGNIKYAGLSPRSTGGSPSNTNGSANGARLTYNINTVLEEDGSSKTSETGSTTGIAPNADISISSGGTSLQIVSNDFSAPFIVDAGYFLRKNKNNSISANGIKRVLSVNNDENAGKSNNIPKVDRAKLKRVSIDE